MQSLSEVWRVDKNFFSYTKRCTAQGSTYLIDFHQPSQKMFKVVHAWGTLPRTTIFFRVFSIGYITHGDFTPSVGFTFDLQVIVCHITWESPFIGFGWISNCSRSGYSCFKLGLLEVGFSNKSYGSPRTPGSIARTHYLVSPARSTWCILSFFMVQSVVWFLGMFT